VQGRLQAWPNRLPGHTVLVLMLSARTVDGRAAALLSRVLLSAVLPLATAYVLISFLIDPANIDTGELRSNSLLMSTHSIFRNIFDPDILGVAVGSSAVLLLTSMVGAIAIGVPAGIAYGWSSRRALRTVAWSLSTVAASLPTFFWAVALELVMIVIWLKFGIRVVAIAGFGIDDHLVLPALALGIRPTAYIFRLTATAVDEIKHNDYVRTAIAKGLPGRVLLARHVLPNAAPNVIAATVLATRGALSSLVIVDFVYVWGGAGLTFVQALGSRRLGLATELALIFAVASVLLALAADFARSRVRVAT
jgi:ABC-type dipeptide/oligopeptide/nickel transport system permease component